MECTYELQEYFYHLQRQLWDINALEPGEFVRSIETIVHTGIEPQVIQIIRQAVIEAKHQRGIIKYIYIIDKLLKIPVFAQLISSFIVQIYESIVKAVLIQRSYKQLEEIKILRKFWVRSLHPVILTQMRDSLLSKTGLDIDIDFKPETVAEIKNYYENKMRLSPEEVAFHLPRSTQRYDESNYHFPIPPQHQASFPEPQLYPWKPPIGIYESPDFQPFEFQPSYLEAPLDVPNYSHPPPYLHQPVSDYSFSNKRKFSQSHPKPIRQENQTHRPRHRSKRHRIYSEETKDIQYIEEGEQNRGHKKIHYDDPYIINKQYGINKESESDHSEEIIKWQQKLAAIQSFNAFSCKECGLSFSQSDTHRAHLEEHMRQRLSNFQKAQKSKLSRCLNLSQSEWSQASEVPISPQNYIVPLCSNDDEYSCVMCSQPLWRAFRDGIWMFTNVVKAEYKSRLILIHKTCSETIIDLS